MKTKNLLYLAGAAIAAYFIFRKKTPTAQTVSTTSAAIINEAREIANDILKVIPGTSETPELIRELPTPKGKALPLQLEIVSSPPKFYEPYMPAMTTEPITITQSETVNYPQLSPSPASILSPDQLIKFNRAATKGQLMGIC